MDPDELFFLRMEDLLENSALEGSESDVILARLRCNLKKSRFLKVFKIERSRDCHEEKISGQACPMPGRGSDQCSFLADNVGSENSMNSIAKIPVPLTVRLSDLVKDELRMMNDALLA